MTELDTPRIRQALTAARDLSRVADARGGAGSFLTGRRLPERTRARALAAEQLSRMGLTPRRWSANWVPNGRRAVAV